ncbi:MAG: alpha/beta fold hydrolase [Candidatus Binatus sp.]|uniref:alpha/beta fold hydrolase n=1 Tax=Candidatus Binatus sp. TaxID=2811406 RepID=UPI00271E1E5F|nr:alpha/beta fold hydrolase [Candidatus Binatus sp.]MDO8432130.1 alpha/beta fold hydrolase [Candidatus Binatus sp.]
MDSTAKRYAEIQTPEDNHPALNAILGANPFVGLDATQVVGTLTMLMRNLAGQPTAVGSRAFQLWLELGQIVAGASSVAPEPGDKRFADPAWSEHPAYRRMMQSYLAWRTAMHDLVNDEDVDWQEVEQQKFALTLITEALSPTNFFFTNPSALKRAFDTAGQSVVRGIGSFLSDLWNNGGMPEQVDKRPFQVGKNLAVSAGAVVFRSPVCEVIQYAPATDNIYQRPLVFIPPQINKFYIMDLAPGRSFVEYAVKHGLPMFTISWRNPTPENRNWGLDDYVTACKDAIAAACEITGSPDCNVLGVCAGGITTSMMLGHLAASGDRRVNSATLLVTMLDTSMPSMTGMFATEDAIKAARDRSAQKGILDGADMARVFAWLRPNDLVWNYWVNNYLLGNDPAPFDILYWNSDSTNLPAKLHAGFLELFLKNPLTKSGEVEILGTPIDLKAVKNDMYLVAGMTDHICAWRSCYRSTRLFGGRIEFVLGSSGHIQSLVNPPGNFKARYYVGGKLPENADEWLKGASENKGTWWDHWIKWVGARSGEERPAPKSLGSDRYKPTTPAPGIYVHEHH